MVEKQHTRIEKLYNLYREWNSLQGRYGVDIVLLLNVYRALLFDREGYAL